MNTLTQALPKENPVCQKHDTVAAQIITVQIKL
jgi:hypothetical protein